MPNNTQNTEEFKEGFLAISKKHFDKQNFSVDELADGLEEIYEYSHSLLTHERATAQKEKEALVREMVEAVEEILADVKNGEENNDFIAAQTMYQGLSTLRETALKAGVKIK